MVEHNQSSYYNNGYKFNGKELDEATGMYYYGARYYDPRISIFISVDPLAEQTMTPYQYVHNNPVNLIDPTGMSAEGSEDECGGPPWKTKQQPTNPHDKPEVPPAQRNTRTALIRIVHIYNLKKGGNLDKEKSDTQVTAPQLFYEWVMGTGKNERNFDENSVMGKQLRATKEVKDAVNELIKSYENSGKTSVDFSRSLSKENELIYPISFVNDLEHNPARALHGSFSGVVSIESIEKTALGTFYLVNITAFDRLGATSGFRLPPIFGGYSDDNSLFSSENPFGVNGNFRTIRTYYNMSVKYLKKE